MRPIPVLITGILAPHLIPLLRAKIRDLHDNLLALARAVALARGSNGTNVRELVAAPAAGSAPGGCTAIVEERGGAGGREDVVGAELPGKGAGGGAAPAGAFVVVVVVLNGGVSEGGKGRGEEGTYGRGRVAGFTAGVGGAGAPCAAGGGWDRGWWVRCGRLALRWLRLW